jgi:hypothetical protein
VVFGFDIGAGHRHGSFRNNIDKLKKGVKRELKHIGRRERETKHEGSTALARTTKPVYIHAERSVN